MSDAEAVAPPTAALPPSGEAATSGGRQPARRLLARLLWSLLWSGLGLLAVLLLVLALVLSTERGLRTAVGLAQTLAPETFSLGEVEGRVLGPLRIADLHLRLPDLEIAVGAAYLDWEPAALLRGRLAVRELTGSGIDLLASGEAPSDPEPFALPQIRLPLGIELEQARIEQLRFHERNAPPETALVLERAELAATLLADRLELRRLEAVLAQPAARLSASGEARLTGDYPLQLDLDWQFQQDPALELHGSGQASGDLRQLQIAHRIEGALTGQLTATLNDLLTRPAWTASINLLAADLPALVPEAPPMVLTAELISSGDLDAATLRGQLSAAAPADLPELGQLHAAIALDWQDQVLHIQTLRLTETPPGTPPNTDPDAAAGAADLARFDLDGWVGLDRAVPAFEIAGDWTGLRWPLVGPPSVAVPAGSLSVTGDLDGFRFALETAASGQDLPPLTLTLQGEGDRRQVQIETLTLVTLGGRIEGSGRIGFDPVLGWDLTLSAADLDPGQHWEGLSGRIALQAKSRGDLAAGFDYRLRLDADLAGLGPVLVTAGGSGDGRGVRLAALEAEALGGEIAGSGGVTWVPGLSWALNLAATGLDPGQLDLDLQPSLAGELGLRLSSSGGLTEGFTYALDADADFSALPPLRLRVTGRGDAKAVELTALSMAILNGQITGTGQVGWVPDLHWELDLNATGLDPGQLDAGLAGAVDFSLASSGGLTDGYTYQADARANLVDLPPAALTLAGQGDAAVTWLETLRIELLDGRIDGSARVAWDPDLTWEAALMVAAIDPGQLAADWPGRLGGRIETSGGIAADGLDLDLRIIDLGGRLRDLPVQLAADLNLRGENLTLDRLTASSGTTRIAASGSLGLGTEPATSALDLRFELRAPDLAALLPGAAGRLDLDGRLTGTTAAPRLGLTLDGSGLRLADPDADPAAALALARVSGELEVGLPAAAPLRLQLDAAGLSAGGQVIDTLEVRGDGSLAEHRLRLAATAADEGPTLVVASSGGLADDGDYRGTLQQLDLRLPGLAELGLVRPAPLALTAGRLALGPLCLGDGRQSAACLGITQPDAERFEFTLDAERIELDLLGVVLPEDLEVSGQLVAAARFTLAGDLLTGNARLDLPAAELRISLPQGEDRLSLAGTRLTVNADAGGLEAALALPMVEFGRIDASLGLPGLRLDAGPGQPLRGRLQVRLEQLQRLPRLVPDLADVSGRVEADLGLGGSLAAPALSGAAAVRGFGLRVPMLGLHLRETDLSLTSQGADAFAIAGSGRVGDGRFTLDGTLAGLTDLPSLRLDLSGRRLQVADTNEYSALVSLDLQAGLGPGGGALRGELLLHEARIAPREIPPEVVMPSPDIVTLAEVQPEPLPFHLDVLVRLGERVQIDAFGLQGRLRGNLRVQREPGRPIVGDGNLEIVDGSFRVRLPGGLGLVAAVGPALRIEQGIVVFAGTPIDNPGLVLNAVREGGDITAGVRVLGTLRQPRLTFFSDSDPNLTQAEITTYLVTGIPPGGGGGGERNLSVGTYIAPRLFMEYDAGLGSQSAPNQVRMRYELTRRIELQTESSAAGQGGMIFFRFER
ncbi:MAG: hypothetical protein EA400_17640 [Chromatiaceae bacterium]|nr:MAG: hypothetical protein EA400_17640 [Chromatiaceae bacterium]